MTAIDLQTVPFTRFNLIKPKCSHLVKVAVYCRLDYQTLSGKGIRVPTFFSGRKVDKTRESGGNQAYSLLQCNCGF